MKKILRNINKQQHWLVTERDRRYYHENQLIKVEFLSLWQIGKYLELKYKCNKKKITATYQAFCSRYNDRKESHKEPQKSMLDAETWRASGRNALSREENSGKISPSLHRSPWATVFISTQVLSTCLRRRLLGTSAYHMLWKIMHTSVLNKLIILHILPYPVVVKIRKDILPV